MPTGLPVASRMQAHPQQRSTRSLDLSCAAIGAIAIGLASFVAWACHDRTGALLIMLLTSGLIAVLLFGPGRGRSH